MHDIFISYSTSDALVAEAAKHFLESQGIRCWKAPESIAPGEIWEEAITNAIQTSSGMLLIWSSKSQSSPQVNRELSVAARSQRVIFPLRIEEIEPEGTFAYYLSNTHWIDALSPSLEEDLGRLTSQVSSVLKAINNTYSKPNNSTKYLTASEACIHNSDFRQGMLEPQLLVDNEIPGSTGLQPIESSLIGESGKTESCTNGSVSSLKSIPRSNQVFKTKSDSPTTSSLLLGGLLAIGAGWLAIAIVKSLLASFWYVFMKGLGY